MCKQPAEGYGVKRGLIAPYFFQGLSQALWLWHVITIESYKELVFRFLRRIEISGLFWGTCFIQFIVKLNATQKKSK